MINYFKLVELVEKKLIMSYIYNLFCFSFIGRDMSGNH